MKIELANEVEITMFGSQVGEYLQEVKVTKNGGSFNCVWSVSGVQSAYVHGHIDAAELDALAGAVLKRPRLPN